MFSFRLDGCLVVVGDSGGVVVLGVYVGVFLFGWVVFFVDLLEFLFVELFCVLLVDFLVFVDVDGEGDGFVVLLMVREMEVLLVGVGFGFLSGLVDVDSLYFRVVRIVFSISMVVVVVW